MTKKKKKNNNNNNSSHSKICRLRRKVKSVSKPYLQERMALVPIVAFPPCVCGREQVMAMQRWLEEHLSPGRQSERDEHRRMQGGGSSEDEDEDDDTVTTQRGVVGMLRSQRSTTLLSTVVDVAVSFTELQHEFFVGFFPTFGVSQ